MQPTLENLTQTAARLKSEGRIAEAIETYRETVRRYPGNGIALHNLAGALGDVALHEEAEKTALAALRTGLDAPETWLVLARAQLGQGSVEPARESYLQVLKRRPAMLQAQFEAAQLVWMTTGNADEALKAVRKAASDAPSAYMLVYIEAQALEFMEQVETARAVLQPLLMRPDCPAEVSAFASHLEARLGRPQQALRLAEVAVAVSRGHLGALEARVRALLAAGDGDKAALAAEELVNRQPRNQHALALLATAWRMTGDVRYRSLYDYGRLVTVARLSVPKGWQSLESYVGDLARELKAAHPFQTHPFGHSVRHGSQRPHILSQSTPAIAAFTEALAGPVTEHLGRLGQGSDPVRQHNTGHVSMIGNWSVWLRPGGYHVDHVHQEGWISSACYVELPAAVNAGGKEGWLRFGKPGVPVGADLAPEYWVRPEPGLVALFPSYMWHGTEPFTGEEPRLTLAFDLVPH